MRRRFEEWLNDLRAFERTHGPSAPTRTPDRRHAAGHARRTEVPTLDRIRQLFLKAPRKVFTVREVQRALRPALASSVGTSMAIMASAGDSIGRVTLGRYRLLPAMARRRYAQRGRRRP